MPHSAKLHTHTHRPNPPNTYVPTWEVGKRGGVFGAESCVALVIIFDPCTAINVAHKIDNKPNWDTRTYTYSPAPQPAGFQLYNCYCMGVEGVRLEGGNVGGMAHNLHEMFLKLFDNILFIRIWRG